MNNHQSQLQEFLTKQSLFKSKGKQSPTFLTHKKYVSNEIPTISTTYKPPTPSKPQQSVVRWSHFGNKRQKRQEGLNINQIEHIEKKLSQPQRAPISSTVQPKVLTNKQQMARSYLASRVQPRPSPRTSQKGQKDKSQLMNKGIELIEEPEPQYEDDPLQTDYEPEPPRIEMQKQTAERQKDIDEKINIWINKDQKQPEKEQKFEQNQPIVLQTPREQYKMVRTDSKMIESFGKTPSDKIQNSRTAKAPRQQSNHKQFVRPATVSKTRDHVFNTYTTQKGGPKLESAQDKNNFFNSTKRDTSRYIDKIRAQLYHSYAKLESREKQIDALIQQNLEIECEKMRNSLIKVIDYDLRQFKQAQKHKLSNAKLTFMADLFEIKDNIHFRLNELQRYRDTLGTQSKWKNVVGQLLTPDYEATIKFVMSKAEDIQDDSLNYTNKFLTEYNNQMFVEVQEPFKRQMRCAIESLFLNFTNKRNKKKEGSSQSKILGDNPKISDLSDR